jgi:DUF917 family protein
MITLNVQQMQYAATGACILASGGGGSYQVSLKILQDGVPAGSTANVVSIPEIDPKAWLCVCANMGAPDALFKTTNPFATGNAFAGLAAKLQLTFAYTCPVEVGAINTVSPLTVAVQKGVPVIDADGAGRSIPTLPLDTFAANGIPLYPNCIAANSPPGQAFDQAGVDIAGPAPEAQAELTFLGVQMSAPFGGIAGLAMYAQTGATLQNAPPVGGTLSLAVQLGQTYATSFGPARLSSIVSQIKATGRACRAIFRGYITNIVQAQGGTDIGYIVVSQNQDGSGRQLWIYNQNENIFATFSDQSFPAVMGPDSMCYLPFTANQTVFDNSDLNNLFQQPNYTPILIDVLAISAPAIVLQNATLMASWQAARAPLGYAGPFSQPWTTMNIPES